MIYNVGIDGGNSTIQVVIEGEKTKPVFPSVTATRKDVDYNNIIRQQGNTPYGHDKLDVTVIRKRDKGSEEPASFLFGHMAENFKARNRENSDKSSDDELCNWMITALAYSLYEYKKKAGEDIGKKLTVRVNLATGIPYREGKSLAKLNKYKNNFKGSHLVKFNHPFFNGLEIELVVENVKVYIEGESALETLIYSKDSEYAKLSPEELAGSIDTIIDLGGFSTEIVGVEFVQNFDDIYDEFDLEATGSIEAQTKSNLTIGLDAGIGHVMKATINDIETKEPTVARVLTRRDIEKALGRQGLYKGKPGYLLPEKVYIKDYFNEHAKNFALEVAKAFHGLYQDGNVKSKIRKIYLTGGGSKIDIVVQTLKETLENDGYDSSKIVCLDDPVYANALGYYFAMIDELSEENIEGDVDA